MEDLIAVVLAAGAGQRLLPHTVDRPKATIPFNGTTPLALLTSSLRAVGVTNVVVVRGLNGSTVQGSDIRVVDSPGPGNMVKSLMSAAPLIPANSSVLLCYGDLIVQRKLVGAMVDREADSLSPVVVAVDEDWVTYYRWRFEGTLGDAESCVVDETGRLTSIGQTLGPGEIPSHQFIGLVRFSPAGFAHAVSVWRELDDRQLQTTQLLQGLIDRGVGVRAEVVRGGWLEIDSLSDLDGALRVCAGQESVSFFDGMDVG